MVNVFPEVPEEDNVRSRTQSQVNIFVYHPKLLGQKVLLRVRVLFVTVVSVLGVFSNHKGLTAHLLPCLLLQVLQLENVIAGLFCQNLETLKAASQCGEVVDRYRRLLQLLWGGQTAVWWFDFEDGKAEVAKKTIILMRSV